MKYLKKIGVFLVIFAFTFQSISTPIYAMSSEEQIKTDDLQTATILLDDHLESVPLYEEDSETSEILTLLQSDEEVIVLEKLDDFSLVEYIENGDDEETFHGFILNDFLNFDENENLEEELFDEEEDPEVENLEESVDESESENDSNTNESDDENAEVLDDISKDEPANEVEDDEGVEVEVVEEVEATSDEDTEDIIVEKRQTFSVQSASLSQQTLFGIALKNKTNVYKAQSTSSGIIRDYAQGSVLKYKTLNSNWYQATVYINGKATTGYIHKNDVENIVDSQAVLHGIALQNPTKIYSKASTGASTLRTYAQGSILKYKTLTSNWYEATVMYNGKWTTGYIHKNDVENSVTNQTRLQGIGTQNPTTVFASASTSSKKLKSYAQGSILTYRTFSNNWYQATVYINGKATTGYIHRTHVENSVTNQTQLQGIGTQSPTTVFASASTSSKKLKSYAQGSILTYRTFSNNWYQATVYINGKATTGYIHRTHVENSVTNQTTVRGIGTQNPTTVYASASTGSKRLKSYAQGSILTYRTFSNNWYQATVYISGKATTGYIHKSHVEEIYDKQDSIDGMAIGSPSNVYTLASKNSGILRSYNKGNFIKFKSFSPNWYEATVIIDGDRKTGYFHKDDVNTSTVAHTATSYDLALNYVLTAQMNAIPKTTYPIMYVHKNALAQNKNGKWSVKGTDWNVRNGPSTNHEIIGKIDERYINDSITVYSTSGDFYRFSTWIIATEKDTEKYLNPANVNRNSTEYFQFLKLTGSAGINAAEVNNKILFNKGIFKNKASSFIKASKDYNINELYLISHAMLETGNGTSGLANGDIYNGVKVYNMYGVGAADGCESPYQCGLKYAYENGWDTPEKAIVGGAKFIAEKYINSSTDKKDTLYKMRWNPEGLQRVGYANGQYATDIRWAEKQTYNLKSYYDLIDSYTLTFDVPVYK